MPEGIMEAVWAFGWGVAAASGLLVGALLGLRTRLSAPRHRRHDVARRGIAAFPRVGAGRV